MILLISICYSFTCSETSIEQMIRHLKFIFIKLIVIWLCLFDLRFCLWLWYIIFCKFHCLFSCSFFLGLWWSTNWLLRCLALHCLIDHFYILSKFLNSFLLHPCLFPLLTANIWSKTPGLAWYDLLLHPIKVFLSVGLECSSIVNNTLASGRCCVKLGPRLALNFTPARKVSWLGIEIVVITCIRFEGVSLWDVPHWILLNVPWQILTWLGNIRFRTLGWGRVLSHSTTIRCLTCEIGISLWLNSRWLVTLFRLCYLIFCLLF